jgi:quercetin dioxygenase-like cupin family protein
LQSIRYAIHNERRAIKRELTQMKKVMIAGLVIAGLIAAGKGVLAQAGADGTQFVRVLPGQENWVDYKGDGAQFGIKEAFIYGDPTKPGLYVIRLKFPPGVMSSPHSHPESRIGTVIKGTWWTGTGAKFDPASTTPVPVGGIMVHPAGAIHYDGARNEETIVQMMGVGPSGKKTVDPSQPGFIKVN